mgnify:CR=1 FL=1
MALRVQSVFMMPKNIIYPGMNIPQTYRTFVISLIRMKPKSKIYL